MKLIQGGLVKTITGGDIENGQILIDGGKIVAVGQNLDVPAGTEIIDAAGCIVTPGFVDAHCHIGMHEEASRWEGNDTNEYSGPVTPEIRAIDGINPRDEAFGNAIGGGVTTAVTGPGSANVLGGTFVAMKLYGDCVDDMILKYPAAMKIAFGENPKGVYGQNGHKMPVTRMAVAATLLLGLEARGALDALRLGDELDGALARLTAGALTTLGRALSVVGVGCLAAAAATVAASRARAALGPLVAEIVTVRVAAPPGAGGESHDLGRVEHQLRRHLRHELRGQQAQ